MKAQVCDYSAFTYTSSSMTLTICCCSDRRGWRHRRSASWRHVDVTAAASQLLWLSIILRRQVFAGLIYSAAICCGFRFRGTEEMLQKRSSLSPA